MTLETYISDLLYRYQCVVVPGFGAFLTQLQPTKIAVDTATFHPPAKRISFNAQLKSNDGLLAKYIADVRQIPYEAALLDIEKTVKHWYALLQNQETIDLKLIGKLQRNEQSNIQFQPSEKANYLTSSFGLTSLVCQPILRQSLKEKVEEVERTTPLLFTPKKRRKYSFLRYAAIFLLIISLGSAGYHIIREKQLQQYEMVQREAQREIEESLQKATFFDSSPAPLPAVTVNLNKTLLRYHVVAGAFRVQANAEKKIQILRAKGYPAKSAGINRYGLHIISYGSFADADESLSFLRTIRKVETPKAWLWISQ